MQADAEEFLKNNAVENFLPMSIEQEIMSLFSLSYYDVERIALEMGIAPLRYKRNQSTISVQEQLKLFNTHISIIGCGGLGGHVAENLVRIGIGTLTLIDFDVFEEHNLNRQNFSNYETLGKYKAEVVRNTLQKINPSVRINTLIKKFEPFEDFNLISESDVVVDALDNPQIKLKLAKVCKQNKINFVHGAIAGFNGQFMTNSTLENVYRDGETGIEKTIGNPSFSVTFAASIQSAEVIKLILNKGNVLVDTILISNLLENEFILV